MARRRPLVRSPHAADNQIKSTSPEDKLFTLDWTELEPGQLVVVLEEHTYELHGRVDTLTEDGEVLWLHLEGGGGRRLFTNSGGDRVWQVMDEGQ